MDSPRPQRAIGELRSAGKPTEPGLVECMACSLLQQQGRAQVLGEAAVLGEERGEVSGRMGIGARKRKQEEAPEPPGSGSSARRPPGLSRGSGSGV